MPDWDDIFKRRGKIFLTPHPDMERIAKLFTEKKIRKILDLGSGTGRHLLFFSKKGFDIYGLDGSLKGIEIANTWLAEEGEEVEIEHCRIEESFPYEDNFFDAIISIQVIHHNFIRDILKTVEEIERVLKKDGVIFITVSFRKKGYKFDKWGLKEVEKRTYIPQKGQEKGLPHHFFSLEEIQSVFKSFELSEIYIDDTYHRAILGVKK